MGTSEIFGIRLIDTADFWELLARLAFNLTVCFIICRLIYYPKGRNNDYLFTFLMFGVLIFLVCYLLRNVKLSIGFAFGLFAVFAILRYRTQTLPIREMTYLFTVIVVATINGMATKKVTYAELLLTNLVITGFTFALDSTLFFRRESSKRVTYDKVDLIHPDKRQELIEDLKKRTGLNIHRVSVERVNYLRDTARLMVYYYDDQKSKRSS